ncbi:ribonuclease H2 subunit C isoform X2 [Eublepharis macularius]|uniref:Ribonuclease H2 subunit C isoform X2 n=1 Tax=Eublepharis macularius TaxID=481883 RepID=A0AA97JXD7_EUBMA|nr:ribonuclease H2 subunit C isoform X2 [Eublepharis macularius]
MAGASQPPVRLALDSLPGAPREQLHLLPCVVQHDGGASVQRYFSPAIRGPQEPQPGDESTVSFRGRMLKGKQVLVPEGYLGLVLEEEEEAPYLSPEERNVRVKSTFESITAWNLERAPNGSDEILMAFSWPKIAEGIHAPVTDEE